MLSGGEIAGITIGVLFGVSLIVNVVFMCRRTREKALLPVSAIDMAIDSLSVTGSQQEPKHAEQSISQEGFDVFHDPGSEATCRVIAIHGLWEESNNTWIGEESLFRLSGIPSDSIAHACIHTYRYVVPKKEESKFKSLTDCAREFLLNLSALQAKQPESYKLLPLIVICHDFGGALFAEAIDEGLQGLVYQIHAVLCLGHPFKPLSLDMRSELSYNMFNFGMKEEELDSYIKQMQDSWMVFAKSVNEVPFYLIPMLVDTEKVFIIENPLDTTVCLYTLHKAFGQLFSSPSQDPAQQEKSTATSWRAFNNSILAEWLEKKISSIQQFNIPTVDQRKNDIDSIQISEKLTKDKFTTHSIGERDKASGYPAENKPTNALSTKAELLERNDNMPKQENSKARSTVIGDGGDAVSPPYSNSGSASPNSMSFATPMKNDIIARAVGDAGSIPGSVQATLAGLATAGSIVALSNAHSARISAKANVKSADAAQLNAEIALAKHILDLEKEQNKDIQTNFANTKIMTDVLSSHFHDSVVVLPSSSLQNVPKHKSGFPRPSVHRKAVKDLTPEQKWNILKLRDHLARSQQEIKAQSDGRSQSLNAKSAADKKVDKLPGVLQSLRFKELFPSKNKTEAHVKDLKGKNRVVDTNLRDEIELQEFLDSEEFAPFYDSVIGDSNEISTHIGKTSSIKDPADPLGVAVHGDQHVNQGTLSSAVVVTNSEPSASTIDTGAIPGSEIRLDTSQNDKNKAVGASNSGSISTLLITGPGQQTVVDPGKTAAMNSAKGIMQSAITKSNGIQTDRSDIQVHQPNPTEMQEQCHQQKHIAPQDGAASSVRTPRRWKSDPQGDKLGSIHTGLSTSTIVVAPLASPGRPRMHSFS